MPTAIRVQFLRDRNPWQADILHHRPNDAQTTGFRSECVNLIRALSDIAKQAFNGIGAANVTMHDLWKGIKRQKMFFILTQAADRFWIAQAVFPFEGCQLRACFLHCLCFPDPSQFGRHLLVLTMGNGVCNLSFKMADFSQIIWCRGYFNAHEIWMDAIIEVSHNVAHFFSEENVPTQEQMLTYLS